MCKGPFCVSKYTCRQILLFTIGVSHGLSAGGVFAFYYVLDYQHEYDDSILLDSNKSEWIVTIPLLLMIPSALLSGILTEKIGRKLTLFLLDILAFASWLLVFIGSNYGMLLTARILSGIYLGAYYPTFVTFLGEVAKPQYRSVLLTAIPLGGVHGLLACSCLGEYFHWKIVASIFAFCPLYNIAIFLHFSESYVTYLDRNYIETARSMFEWFRGHDDATRFEFEAILEEYNNNSKKTFREAIQLYTSKGFLKPLFIVTIVFLTFQCTGIQAVQLYTMEILTMFDDDEDFLYYAVIGITSLNTIGFVLSLILIKIISVRCVLIFSGYIFGTLVLALGLFMYCSSIYSLPILKILHLIIVTLITISYWIGLGPLPVVICGEMFPQSTRSTGISISATLLFLFAFIDTKLLVILYPLGPYWIFILLGLRTIVGIATTHRFLPITKNKTLLEINMTFQSKTH